MCDGVRGCSTSIQCCEHVYLCLVVASITRQIVIKYEKAEEQ